MLSAVPADRGRPLPGVRLIELVDRNFRLFQFLLKNSVITFLAENLFTFPQVLDQNFIFEPQHI